MVQTLPASKVTLRDLIDRVGLLGGRTPDFFREWQDDRPEITQYEHSLRVIQNF